MQVFFVRTRVRDCPRWLYPRSLLGAAHVFTRGLAYRDGYHFGNCPISYGLRLLSCACLGHCADFLLGDALGYYHRVRLVRRCANVAGHAGNGFYPSHDSFHLQNCVQHGEAKRRQPAQLGSDCAPAPMTTALTNSRFSTIQQFIRMLGRPGHVWALLGRPVQKRLKLLGFICSLLVLLKSSGRRG